MDRLLIRLAAFNNEHVDLFLCPILTQIPMKMSETSAAKDEVTSSHGLNRRNSIDIEFINVQ